MEAQAIERGCDEEGRQARQEGQCQKAEAQQDQPPLLEPVETFIGERPQPEVDSDRCKHHEADKQNDPSQAVGEFHKRSA